MKLTPDSTTKEFVLEFLNRTIQGVSFTDKIICNRMTMRIKISDNLDCNDE